jgi:hypothetical protein
MAHLTLGELRPVHHAAAGARLAQVQAQPGYGFEALRQHSSVMPKDLADAELLRLRQLQDQGADPITYALNQLKRAYEDDDIRVIRRWQRVVENAGGRRYLRAIEARNASYRQRGIMGLNGLGDWRQARQDARFAEIYRRDAVKQWREEQKQAKREAKWARREAKRAKRDRRFVNVQSGGHGQGMRIQSVPGAGRIVCYRPSPYLSGMGDQDVSAWLSAQAEGPAADIVNSAMRFQEYSRPSGGYRLSAELYNRNEQQRERERAQREWEQKNAAFQRRHADYEDWKRHAAGPPPASVIPELSQRRPPPQSVIPDLQPMFSAKELRKKQGQTGWSSYARSLGIDPVTGIRLRAQYRRDPAPQPRVTSTQPGRISFWMPQAPARSAGWPGGGAKGIVRGPLIGRGGGGGGGTAYSMNGMGG